MNDLQKIKIIKRAGRTAPEVDFTVDNHQGDVTKLSLAQIRAARRVQVEYERLQKWLWNPATPFPCEMEDEHEG